MEKDTKFSQTNKSLGIYIMDPWIAFIGFIPLKWCIPCKHMAVGHSFEFFFAQKSPLASLMA